MKAIVNLAFNKLKAWPSCKILLVNKVFFCSLVIFEMIVPNLTNRISQLFTELGCLLHLIFQCLHHFFSHFLIKRIVRSQEAIDLSTILSYSLHFSNMIPLGPIIYCTFLSPRKALLLLILYQSHNGIINAHWNYI